MQAPLLRLLSLAASLSYFKAFAPTDRGPRRAHRAVSATFLTGLLRHGMGEFAYVNDLPEVFETAVVASSLPTRAPFRASEPPSPKPVLVAVGGGKDSIVSIEALQVGWV